MARAFARTSNSVGQYIDCGNAAALNPANNLSMACWVYPTSLVTGHTAHFYISRDNGGNARCYSILSQAFQSVNNTFETAIFKNNTTGTGLQSTTVMTTNTWFHLCSTYQFVTDGTSVFRLYVNGSQEASSTSAVGPINQATTSNEIGRRPAGLGAFPANARMADVGIWNQTLTAAEVASLADGMSCDKVRGQGLLLYAPLVRDLIDLKGNTLTNNSTTVVDHPRIYS
jgi:hypothetical protein